MTSAIKCIKQRYSPTPCILEMLDTFRKMVNESIRIGLQNGASTMKRLCQLSYHRLSVYDAITYYKLCAISKAAGILNNRKKSINRGYSTKKPYVKKRFLVSCYGFKLDGNRSILKVPLGGRKYFDIPLNDHTTHILSDSTLVIRSFTLTEGELVISYSKDVNEIKCNSAAGVDRNLGNLTVGNSQEITQYNLDKTVKIAENTRAIISSFKRNDRRIRQKLYAKYGRRKRNRISQMLHRVSKAVVQKAKQDTTALVFEDITHIRKLYRQGNGQGKHYRGKMNDWSFAEIKRLITYKADWEGIPVIQLTRGETRNTSKLCPRCGKRTQMAERSDVFHKRQLLCPECNKWMDRDVVAAMNLSIRGWLRFSHSKGDAGEAMKGNPGRDPVVLRADASKSSLCGIICQRPDRTYPTLSLP